MKNTQPKRNIDVQDNYNSKFAVNLRELLEKSPRTNERTTYKVLAEYLNVKQQSVSSWANGTTIADTKHLAPIAEYFGVSTDYLLGLTGIKKPDINEREVSKKYGLCEAALNALSDLPEAKSPAYEMEDRLKIERCADTMSYRAVINLLLSHEIGKQVLRFLSSYFYSTMHPDSKPQKYTTTWKIDDERIYGQDSELSKNLSQDLFLMVAQNELYRLKREMKKGHENK
jgi:transcriptional regulator with XRE-family HTH domain